MTKNGVLTGFSLSFCLLLLVGTASVAAATNSMASPLQTDPGFSCTFSVSPYGPYSANFSGILSGGPPPYGWTLYFGDGLSTSGSLGASGDSYSASHTYSTNGTYTAEFKAHDTQFTHAPDTCDIFRQVTIKGPITVNASLAENIVVADNAAYTSAQSLTETIRLTDTALSPATVVLKESLGLLDAIGSSVQSMLTEIISLVETGHISSTSTVQTQTTSGSGNGSPPQFPYQYVAIPVAGAVLVLSYLFIRKYWR
jgi:hypothetical protein